jgi:hypothetical protein
MNYLSKRIHVSTVEEKMTKYTIMCFLLMTSLPSYCQNLVFSVDCSDSLLMTIKGKYTKYPDAISPYISSILPKAQQPEALRRMDAMHKLLLEAYPQPLGMDGRWRRDLYAGMRRSS